MNKGLSLYWLELSKREEWATGTENGRYMNFHSALIRRFGLTRSCRSSCKS
jgi:hypothetical protein